MKQDYAIKFDYEGRIRALEKRVTLIEMKRGKKLDEIAEWIESMFDRKDIKIRVKTIRILSKKEGYSWQMVQRARREILGDKIGAVQWQAKGWHWTNDKRYV